MSVTRFDISGYDFDFDISGCDFDIAEDTEGDWVRYVDHAAALTAAADRIEAMTAKLAKVVEVLESLIQQTHDCEKELTEDLHHVDFCGESEPLTKARTTLAEIKGESHA